MVRNLFAFLLIVAATCVNAAPPKPAYELLPQSTQAVVWIRSSDDISNNWSKTQLSQLADDPSISAFWNDQRDQIENKLMSAGWRLQVQPRDVGDIVQGQIALAWIDRSEDTRKSFALALIVDVVDKADQTKKFLEKLDQQLKDRGARYESQTYSDIRIVQHSLKRQSGELLPQETFYAVVDEQLFVSDDLTTIKALIDSAKQGNSKALNTDAAFVASRSELKVSNEGDVEYFVRPLGFARVIRAISGKRVSTKTDVLAVLQKQGFDVIRAVAGEIKIGDAETDLLHRGFIYADGSRATSVQVLDFPNSAQRGAPPWVPANVSSFATFNWNVKEAFWKVEGLVDEMAGQKGVFTAIIDGIRDDPTGPKIDVAKEVMPLLTNDIYTVNDIKLPVDIDSRRNLIALQITDSQKMESILRRAMSNEPDAKEIEINGQSIWQVVHKEEDLNLDLDNDFGGFDSKKSTPAPGNDEKEDPLLNNWAITVYAGGKGDDYLMFASHAELIAEVIEQAKAKDREGLSNQKDYDRVASAIKSHFGTNEICAWKINRSSIAYQAQYELFRTGKLQQSQSMLATIFEHLLQNKSEIEQKKPTVDGAKLPAFEMISKYLQPSGMVVSTTEKGWSFGSVLLAKPSGAPQAEPTASAESNAATKPVQGGVNR